MSATEEKRLERMARREAEKILVPPFIPSDQIIYDEDTRKLIAAFIRFAKRYADRKIKEAAGIALGFFGGSPPGQNLEHLILALRSRSGGKK